MVNRLYEHGVEQKRQRQAQLRERLNKEIEKICTFKPLVRCCWGEQVVRLSPGEPVREERPYPREKQVHGHHPAKECQRGGESLDARGEGAA